MHVRKKGLWKVDKSKALNKKVYMHTLTKTLKKTTASLKVKH